MTTETLNQRFLEAWELILDGVSNRHSPNHTPVVATIGAGGLLRQRVMVLRAADKQKRQLRFHTDVRAIKVADLTASGVLSILLYDKETKVQIRLSGIGRIQTKGADIDIIWHEADRFARRCYLAEAAPGSVASEPISGLPDWVKGIKPEEADLIPARANFAVLLAEIKCVEWLYLATTGHRRARWDWDDTAQAWNGCWLTP
jgi:pyridoxamine 5'-phosphate oxidase